MPHARPLAVLAALAALGAAPSALAQPGPAPAPSPMPPTPVTAVQLNAPTAAGWACNHDRCAYVKPGSAWSDCFTARSPSHNVMRPTTYCH